MLFSFWRVHCRKKINGPRCLDFDIDFLGVLIESHACVHVRLVRMAGWHELCEMHVAGRK